MKKQLKYLVSLCLIAIMLVGSSGVKAQAPVTKGTVSSSTDVVWINSKGENFSYAGTPVNSYRGPNGVTIRSFTSAYSDTEKLKAVYDELLKNTIGPEISYLSYIDLVGGYPYGYGTAGQWFGMWNSTGLEKGRYIEIYGCNTIDFTTLARVLSHEYGHHFTYYYMTKKEGINPDNILSSGFSKLRGLNENPYVDDGEHMWDPSEIAAEDYVQLFGSNTGKKSTLFTDIRDDAAAGSATYKTVSSLMYNVCPQENFHIPLAWQVKGLYQFWTSLSGLSAGKSSPPAAPLITMTKAQGGAYTLGWSKSMDDTTANIEYTVVYFNDSTQDLPGVIRTTTDSNGRDAIIGTYSSGRYTVKDGILTSTTSVRVYAKDSDGNVVGSNDLIIDPACPEASLSMLPDRIAGFNRYETSVAISNAGWSSTSDTAVLVTGSDFPDALSAAPLAKQLNAPILLTDSKTLTKETEDEIITRLKVKNIVIVGGINAVSSDIENYLKNRGINCSRISGSDRYGTSIEVAKRLNSFDSVILATGNDFPDALSIASYAASKGMPILLTGNEALPSDVAGYIKGMSLKTVYVIGGNKVIPDSILYGLSNIRRIAGSNRYDTNMAVMNQLGSMFNMGTVYIATGEDFPDALSGSVLAALSNSPIFLVNNGDNLPVKDFISGSHGITNVDIIGGESAVSNSTVLNIISAD